MPATETTDFQPHPDPLAEALAEYEMARDEGGLCSWFNP